jgi:hypothetical protein
MITMQGKDKETIHRMDPGSEHKPLKHSKKRGGFKRGLNSLP